MHVLTLCMFVHRDTALFVGHNFEPCKNSWTNQDGIEEWVYSGNLKEP